MRVGTEFEEEDIGQHWHEGVYFRSYYADLDDAVFLQVVHADRVYRQACKLACVVIDSEQTTHCLSSLVLAQDYAVVELEMSKLKEDFKGSVLDLGVFFLSCFYLV